MSVKELHRDEEFVLYEYNELSERPATPNALQYQEAYRNTDDGSLFYRLYEFIGDNRKANILDFFSSKISLAKEANDTRTVDQLTSLKKCTNDNDYLSKSARKTKRNICKLFEGRSAKSKLRKASTNGSPVFELH